MPFFSKSPSPKPTRLFFATDLHASERAFRKFINAGKFYNVDVLVMGGDVVGKLVVPILRERNGKYRATYGDQTHEVETQEELKRLQAQLGMMGYYFRVMDQEEFRALEHDRTAIEQLFHTLARERLTQWIEFADARLSETRVTCFMMGGNDDAPDILQVLSDAKSEYVIPCEDKVVPLDAEHTMLSLGYSTPTPWHTPREISDEQLGQKIEALACQVPDLSRCVFNLHDPPKESSLDLCAMVEDGNPPRHVLKGGQPVMHSAGSAAVRYAIETFQPLLGLHGHIHESPGVIRIGRTLCVNPGSEYNEGILRGMIAIFQNGKLQGHQLTAG